MRIFIIILFLDLNFLTGDTGYFPVARCQSFHGTVVMGKISGKDTLLFYNLPEVRVFDVRVFKTEASKRRYDRLVFNVKKVYPYAKMAMTLLDEYNKNLSLMDRNREKKHYLTDAEKDLFKKYRNEIEDLTITQGRILIKLIDRQTGHTSFDLIKNYKGTFPAYFWQTLAVLFGSNLKMRYDPSGEDRMIEDIVVLIDSGQI